MQKKPQDLLPDPLIVRLYREAKLGDVAAVHLDKDRNVTVTYENGSAERYLHLKDVGWVPDTGDGTCAM